MNHHVRNSLQVIFFATSAQQDERTAELRNVVERLEWGYGKCCLARKRIFAVCCFSRSRKCLQRNRTQLFRLRLLDAYILRLHARAAVALL
jgi:hypothetical protein